MAITSPDQRRKGGQKPIYSASEERKQRNRQVHPAFRERREDYVKQLEARIKSHEHALQNLRESCRTSALEPTNRGINQSHGALNSATTRVYDPRTHIFRSKKAFDSRPGVLSAPEGLNTRSYSVLEPGNKRSSLEFESGYQDYQAGSLLPYDNFNKRDPSLLLQPETRPISQEQLVNEVKGIYAGLVMVEKKCVEIDNQQAQDQAEGRIIKLSHEHWQALIALHRTLLHEHHDFFLASQHPFASPTLRKLAAKYDMPARMWQHGIHSSLEPLAVKYAMPAHMWRHGIPFFLESPRHRLPDSLDHMLAFIYLAYSMMALLKESVPAFEDTWIECLGDLARYRMAIEDENFRNREVWLRVAKRWSHRVVEGTLIGNLGDLARFRMAIKNEDLRDREVWSEVARYWYNKAADKSLRIGRIQHHLAVLAWPNALQQLFYYTRALTCILPFLNARESILTLFNPILEDNDAVIHRRLPIDIAFIKAHGILFKQGPLPTFDEHTEKFLSLLDNNIGRVTPKWREQGVWIASSNFFGVLSCVGVGSRSTDTLFSTFSRIPTHDPTRSIELAKGIWISYGQDSNSQPPDSALLHVSHLTFATLALALLRIGDKNVLPHVHVSLAFLFCVALVPEVMRSFEQYVPWALLVAFLNTLGKPGVKFARVEAEQLPAPENGIGAYLPEDFSIRGQVWCQQYHPEGFFGEDYPVGDEERSLEMPSIAAVRFNRWMTYDDSRQYHPAGFFGSDYPIQHDTRITIRGLSSYQISTSRALISTCGQTILSRTGDAVCGSPEAATEAFKAFWSCSTGLMHVFFSSSTLASLFIKLWLLYMAIPLAAAQPIDENRSTSSAKPYTYSSTLNPTPASSSVIGPVRLSVEDILFMALAALSPVAFHLFGRRTGNQLFATGAAMVPANIVHLMTWEGGSVGAVGRLSTLFLALLATGAFGCHVFGKYAHMGPGHGIAIFFSTLGLVWLCPRGSSSLIGDQTDSPTQYIIPCLAVSLVCWYRLAPLTESYAERQTREAREASEQAAKAHVAKEQAAREEAARDETAREEAAREEAARVPATGRRDEMV